MSSPTPSLSPGAWLALSRWTGCCVRSLLSPSFTAGTRAERSQKMAPASGLGGGLAPLPSMSPVAWLARSSWTAEACGGEKIGMKVLCDRLSCSRRMSPASTSSQV